jgi:hypothetical protein
MSNKKEIHDLADKIFDVKEKLSDGEYKDLMESVAKINNEKTVSISVLEPVQMQNNNNEESVDDLIKNFHNNFYNKCKYPNCNEDVMMMFNYCGKHTSSKYKKTSDDICKYKDTENNQCKKYANIGNEYCLTHIKNHEPKPPKKKTTTEDFKCEYMIKENKKTGKINQCKKYALLGNKFCSIHNKNN